MIKRTEACFGIKPEWLVGDTAYGSAPNLEWLVNELKIAPYIPVIDKSSAKTVRSHARTSSMTKRGISTPARPGKR